ncbi:hypothetical protein ACB092_05G116700 [Castanea dentata]
MLPMEMKAVDSGFLFFSDLTLLLASFLFIVYHLSHLQIIRKNLSDACRMNQAENQKVALEFWKSALNPLTWTKILREVLVDAAFGSKLGAMRREALNEVFKLLTLGFAPDLSVYLKQFPDFC